MHLFPDFKDLLAAFGASGVEYVLIGGYAVAFHGRPRSTNDIKFLVSLDQSNLDRLGRALDAFGAPQVVVEGARKLAKDEVIYFGTSRRGSTSWGRLRGSISPIPMPMPFRPRSTVPRFV